MDIFNASTMGMMFTQVTFDKLLGGDVETVENVQCVIAEKLGGIIGTAGGFTPALQQMMTSTMTVKYPEAVQQLVKAGSFLKRGNQTLAQLRHMSGRLGPHAIHIASASQIGASTTSAFVTMCHIVASYDNAVKLQEANAKLDELLQVHSRQYRAELEAIYNQLGDLLLKHASGFSMIAELGNSSQQLDQLVIIWLDQIIGQLKPVNTATDWTGFLAGIQYSNIYATTLVGIPWALLCSGPTTGVARWCYVSWANDLRTRLDKVNRLTRLVAIATWLRHVVSHHTASVQPLYHQYGRRLEQIGTMAGNIKEAVDENRKMILIDGQITRQLEWEQQLPQRIQAILQTPTVVPPRTDKAEAELRVYFERETRSFCLDEEVSHGFCMAIFACCAMPVVSLYMLHSGRASMCVNTLECLHCTRKLVVVLRWHIPCGQ